jgi:regulator of RNase E activity RraB
MGFFNFFTPKPTNFTVFVSDQQFKNNLESQVYMTRGLMSKLRSFNVGPEKQLKLEYFFYTNSLTKARDFAEYLKKLNYNSQYGTAAQNRELFVINGWTPNIKMEEDVICEWTKQMVQLGYTFDCEFDGWGTFPEQGTSETVKNNQ